MAVIDVAKETRGIIKINQVLLYMPCFIWKSQMLYSLTTFCVLVYLIYIRFHYIKATCNKQSWPQDICFKDIFFIKEAI